MKNLKGALVFAQSGGPTSVINSSAAGVFTAALESDAITAVSGRDTDSRRAFLDAFRRDFLKRQILLQVLRGGRLYQVRMGI